MIPAVSAHRNFTATLSFALRGLLRQARAAAVMAGLLSTGCAMAAGGHHAVDDAAIADPGACKLESWWSAARGGDRLLHAGGGCRVGPVELNPAVEYSRPGTGDGSETATSVQVKWATELAPGFSAGLELQGNWQAHVRPRHQGTTLVTLFTWAVRDDFALHLNLGRDFVRSDADQNRGGVSAEWKALSDWSLVAERYLDSGTHFLRAGARWAVTESWSVDVSRAQRLHGPAASNWTLGTTWQFGR